VYCFSAMIVYKIWKKLIYFDKKIIYNYM
jgi:hypothetical protein